MSESGLGGMSADEYDGLAGYSSAAEYNNELEVQEKIRTYEDKMLRATLNRHSKLQECQGKLQY